jgi:hypothetical protein
MTAGKHRPVPAAEKYAELAAKGEERENCECHEMPQYWIATSRRPAGGFWRCAEQQRERMRVHMREYDRKPINILKKMRYDRLCQVKQDKRKLDELLTGE